ncbi:family 20 glycosylhydrolase [Carboxylicivirga taeanensis]|uniref:family 20 glycosylhydrolase n=1 Tax=Carboxylicivirga taeanensis TaxID=1416875 RepID=UPI003F6DB465
MNNILSILLCALLLTQYSCQRTSDTSHHLLNIIPQPKSVSYHEETFQLGPKTLLVYKGLDKNVLQTIAQFNAYLQQHSGMTLTLTDDAPDTNYILFQVHPMESAHDEAYELMVAPTHIQVNAQSSKGLFYALQTFKQLLPPAFEANSQNQSHWEIPCVSLSDYPDFEYRGLNIDVARHYFPVEFIKKQIELLALYKINVLHWHLTDDQGWRVEIKKYPKLTSIGSHRSKTLIGHGANPPFKYDDSPYSGFYTQDEIRDIVNFAREHHIEIVPEIELPGHSLAALAAYPQLGCTGGPYEVATRWGVFDDVMCPGKESTFAMIDDILTEIADLFPGQYIHIGGDACTKTRWRNCKHCQARIKSKGFENENDLEHYFIKRVQQTLTKLDKKMVGWNEIMKDSTLKDALIILWQDDVNFKQAVGNNNKIIKSPNNFLYFDHYQASPQNHPLAIGGYTPLKDVYHYKPLGPSLNKAEKESIIGLQANCWTEYMPTTDKFEFMLYPRLCAFSEIAWGNDGQKDWPEFRRKLENHLERLSAKGVNYFYEVPKPIPNKEQLNFTHPTTLSFKHIADKYSIRYTLDGSEPDLHSQLYSTPIPVNASGTIKAITVNTHTGEQSKTEIFSLNQLQFQKPVARKKLSPGLSCSVYKGRFKMVKEIKNTSKDQQRIILDNFIPDSICSESFGIIATGYFKSEQKGIYEFELTSDDGSALYVGKELVVNNDGIHGSKTEKGAIALREGLYPVTIYYFQTTGYCAFDLNIKLPDNTSHPLKPSDFYF